MVNKGLTETVLYFMKNISFFGIQCQQHVFKKLKMWSTKAREVSGAKLK